MTEPISAPPRRIEISCEGANVYVDGHAVFQGGVVNFEHFSIPLAYFEIEEIEDDRGTFAYDIGEAHHIFTNHGLPPREVNLKIRLVPKDGYLYQIRQLGLPDAEGD